MKIRSTTLNSYINTFPDFYTYFILVQENQTFYLYFENSVDHSKLTHQNIPRFFLHVLYPRVRKNPTFQFYFENSVDHIKLIYKNIPRFLHVLHPRKNPDVSLMLLVHWDWLLFGFLINLNFSSSIRFTIKMHIQIYRIPGDVSRMFPDDPVGGVPRWQPFPYVSAYLSQHPLVSYVAVESSAYICIA